MTKDNQNTSIIILSLIILIFFAVYYFLYGYVFALGQNVFDLSQKLQQDSLQGQSLKQSVDVFNQITPQIDAIDSYFVSSDGEVAFIDLVEGKAKNLALIPEINSVQIETSKDLSGRGLQYLTLKMSVKGTWPNVYKFVSLLPNLPYQIIVSQADLTNVSGATNSASPVWQGTFVLRIIMLAQ